MALLDVRTLSNQVFEKVRDRILSGALAADAPIRQDALALELGVSKIPVREALSKLESDGLVASHPYRGFVVRPLSREEAEDVFDLRLKLEPDATALGARRADADAQAAAQAALAALDRALRAHAPDVGRRNREFHLALVRPAGRDVTVQTIERVLTLAERYVSVHLGPRGRSDRARREHQDLLEAWLKRRETTVRKKTEQHINATLRDLRAQLPAD
jgi:DNA-binding GntR family transcriptional regulator